MNIQQFQQLLEEKGISLSSKQLNQFEKYYQVLVEWNEKMNLTAITDHGEVYEKHFYDSISAAFFQDFTEIESMCDVGAGAGFPSIPIKICFPHLHVTIVDSLQKRITFLTHLVNELELDNVTLCHDRAETFGKKETSRESFDLVTARAVARISVLNEFCLPLVKEQGRFLAMKGASAPEELKNGEKSFQVLGGKVKSIEHFQLPLEQSERYIILIDKIKKTPKKYPRKPGTPVKLPLE
ncbi:16S rRNA (guanine(527)-N(7))-methyltransferase RsmG [Priestia megaterium]|uniref:16S rRNA (guanine(527)-N(7))-methyltransferase RsmG n=1 Tax=Priestia megaterium TaxID=1404 RepID=UPI00101B5F93|nr:16S rRNA (guanine(527)-N(7))-methyltransferase RsmG [Priestia megaterium]MDO6846346.1 16S rRNA (guanine(527)-N(7))-methyltransferase RsmG [Priestia megaterium]